MLRIQYRKLELNMKSEEGATRFKVENAQSFRIDALSLKTEGFYGSQVQVGITCERITKEGFNIKDEDASSCQRGKQQLEENRQAAPPQFSECFPDPIAPRDGDNCPVGQLQNSVSSRRDVYKVKDFLLVFQEHVLTNLTVCGGDFYRIFEFIRGNFTARSIRLRQHGLSETDLDYLKGFYELEHFKEPKELQELQERALKFSLVHSEVHVIFGSKILERVKEIYNIVSQIDPLTKAKVREVLCQQYNIKTIVQDLNFRQKVNMMSIGSMIFLPPDHQHFPRRKKCCAKCKVCSNNQIDPMQPVRKSKYYCKACYLLTGMKWSLCLDKCFQLFHQNPSRYLHRRKRMDLI